jgi:spore coat protein CotH
MGFVLTWALGCVAIEGRLAAADPPVVDAPPGVDREISVPLVPELPSEPWSGIVARGEPGDQLFAEATIHDFALTLSDEAYRALRDHPDEQVQGVLTWHGVAYDAGIKIKGSSSFRSIRQKASFKIDVHQYDRERRIDGLKRLTLNNMIQDATMLREHAYYWLAGALAIPAPRHGYARVTVNGEPFGLYGLVETMDGRLMKRLFPDDKDGNLYEASGADFTEARNWFDLQVDGGIVPTPDDMDDLVRALEGADSDAFAGVFAERFDLEPVLRYLALDIVTGNDDGYVFNHHNYHAYHYALSDRWVLLPWGTDRSFTQEVSPYGAHDTPIMGELVRRCWGDDTCAGQLREQIEAVLHVWEDGGFPEMLAAGVELVADACEVDPRREKRCDQEEIQAFVDERAAYVREHLE